MAVHDDSYPLAHHVRRTRIPRSDEWRGTRPVIGEWRKRFLDEHGNPLPESYTRRDVTTGEVVEVR